MNRLNASLVIVALFCHQLCANHEILLKASIHNSTLTIEPTPFLKETFLNNQNFEITYDRPITSAPATVLTIPYIMCMSPLLSLSGKSYTIKER